MQKEKCYSCGSGERLYKMNARSGEYIQYICRICNNALKKRYYDKGKILVLKHYGNQCKCCGESVVPFLSIDHVNNNSSTDRWPNGSRITGVHLYRRLVTRGFPEGYQILCMNCNFGKRMNWGVCPHQTV